ncbi:NAD-dependent epimerase/dehydratase family protein [Chondromyces apiculatus]|uniref:Dihydroflavonol-4-reductase n=1 Tax=Chondromyces apiculatus DSM 436 TaxID=1192034 RepID=A0A017TI91_9BACT|nr:NAD-dependent epimerase/dehydratase family protein [Chondromyces apiculatus]EYF08974.1 Dihydroflavonol-4-reductase [Chondromyces apiculatus DSM 436]
MGEVVAVSGAAGFIGSAVVRKILDGGRSVRALVEPGTKSQNLDGLPPDRVEIIPVDVCDYVGMARALDGCAAFHHLAAIYKTWMPDPRPIYRVNLEGTTTALLAARAARVPRIVYTSSIAAIGLRDDGAPSDETVAWNLQEIANDYVLTKHLSERTALRFAEAGLPVVVVNPGFPFGPGDAGPTPTGRFLLSLLRRETPAVGAGGVSAVDVDDVADGHLAAETRGRVGERYILANHNVSFIELARLVEEISGVPAPTLHVPGWAGRGIALGMELWANHVTHTEPAATYKSLRYIQQSAYVDASKARRELDFPCTPLRTSVERAISWFRAQGMA